MYVVLCMPVLALVLDWGHDVRERVLAGRGRKGEDGDGGDMGKDARRGRRGGAGARRRAALQKEASDFWERHRLERERGYHIPQVNRRHDGTGPPGGRLDGGGTGGSSGSGTFARKRR